MPVWFADFLQTLTPRQKRMLAEWIERDRIDAIVDVLKAIEEL